MQTWEMNEICIGPNMPISCYTAMKLNQGTRFKQIKLGMETSVIWVNKHDEYIFRFILCIKSS